MPLYIIIIYSNSLRIRSETIDFAYFVFFIFSSVELKFSRFKVEKVSFMNGKSEEEKKFELNSNRKCMKTQSSF